MHVDLWIPTDQLHERLQSAITAGGQLLTDEYAPAFWVLADAEGNHTFAVTNQEFLAAKQECIRLDLGCG